MRCNVTVRIRLLPSQPTLYSVFTVQ